jgi:adenosylcobinamide-phosphate synthase
MFMSFSEQYFGDQILHWILALAFILDALVGDPQWLYRYVPHPVAILGELIGRLDSALNSPKSADLSRRYAGALMVLGLVGSAAAIGWLLGWGLRMVSFEWAWIGEAIVVAVLIANRDLYGHVRRVAAGLDENLDAGRCAVGHIVGRDPQSLDEAGVARAAIESTAENFSDGVVAPVFFYVVFGLPGILAYKTINTLDSMVGYRNERYEAFGWAAARLDDLANFLPARLAGIIFVLSAFILPNASGRAALVAMRRDAPKHGSPNAGWPEAAMAGALGLSLAGPRVYGEHHVEDSWMGEGRRDAGGQDILGALHLYGVAGTLILGLGFLILRI